MSTTTANLQDLIYNSVIQDYFLATMGEHAIGMLFCKEFDIRNSGSNKVKVPYFQSIYGSGNDDGEDVDTEFGGVDGTVDENMCLTPIAMATSSVELSCYEYGLAVCISDGAVENTISGSTLLDRMRGEMQRAIGLAWSRDWLDLFQNLTQVEGVSGTQLTVADILAAQARIREAGVVVNGGLVAVLDNVQIRNLEGELISTSGGAASLVCCDNSLIGYGPGNNYGLAEDRRVMNFRGMPVYSTGLGAHAGTDVVGAVFTPASGNDRNATFGNVIGRSFRFESDRDILCRQTTIALTACMGPGILQDASGVALVTGE